MNKALTFLLFVLLLSSCNHRIIRNGYSETKGNAEAACDIRIRKYVSTDSINGNLLGTIKLKDKGFSTNCNEGDARKILVNEGCRLGANFVNIIHEEQPGFMSTCYRCEAQFYTLKDPASLHSDQLKSDFNQELMLKKDKSSEVWVYLLSFLAGFTLTTLLLN